MYKVKTTTTNTQSAKFVENILQLEYKKESVGDGQEDWIKTCDVM